MPNRLATWRGAQHAMGLPISEVRVCYGIDGRQFDNLFPLADLAISLGINWEKIHSDGLPRADETRYASLRLGIDLILNDIQERPPGWYTIWLDDEILNVPYSEFLHTFKKIESTPHVQVVACNTDRWYNKDFTVSNEIGTQRWQTKAAKRHLFLPIYQGCVGCGFDRCLVLTPQGAKHLLTFGGNHPADSYEWLAFHKLNEDFPYFWTAAPNLSQDIGWIMGSESDNGEAHAIWNLMQSGKHES